MGGLFSYCHFTFIFKKRKDWLPSFARFWPNGSVLPQKYMDQTSACATFPTGKALSGFRKNSTIVP